MDDGGYRDLRWYMEDAKRCGIDQGLPNERRSSDHVIDLTPDTIRGKASDLGERKHNIKQPKSWLGYWKGIRRGPIDFTFYASMIQTEAE